MNNEHVYLANQAPKRMFLTSFLKKKIINSEATYVCVKANLLSKDIEKEMAIKSYVNFHC